MASSGSFNTGGYGGRYLTFKWWTTNKDIANNRTTISWQLVGAGGSTTSWYNAGNFKVDIDGVTVYSSGTRIRLYNGTVVASGSRTIGHAANGTRSFGAYAEAGIYTNAVNCSGSGSWALDTIPRQANITSAPNFNDTQNPTIKYSNPAGNSVSSLQAAISNSSGSAGYAGYRNISKTGSSYTFSLTDAERNAMRSAAANSKTLAVRFYVKTVIGGNTYYSYKNVTMTVANANPTFNVAYKDTKASTVAVTENDQLIVRNNSTLQINITNAQAYKYATLKTASCTILGRTYSANISNGSATLNIGTVNSSSNLTVPVVVTDSRGYTTTKNLTIQVLDWTAPTAIISLKRHNNFYSDTDINVNAQYASIEGGNTLSIKVRYKKVTDASYSDYETLQNNVTSVLDLDNNYEWNVQVVVTDKFGSTTYNMIVSRGLPIIFFDRLKSSTGFNCFPKLNNSVEANGAIITKNIMTRSLSAAMTNLAVNDYTIIPFDLSNSIGGALTATNDGGIKIGAGVSKVLISALLSYDTINSTSSKHMRIIKNTYNADNTLAWSWQTLVSGQPANIEILPILADVQEDDVLYALYYTNNANDKIGGNTYGCRTSMTVEVVG